MDEQPWMTDPSIPIPGVVDSEQELPPGEPEADPQPAPESDDPPPAPAPEGETQTEGEQPPAQE